MSRVTIATVLIVLIVVSTVWIVTRPDENGGVDVPPVDADTQAAPGLADAVNLEESSEPPAFDTELAATGIEGEDIEEAPDTPSCDPRQIETLQQFNRDNLRRREASVMSAEAAAAYRDLSLNELDALARQDDSLAMMIYGLRLLFLSMGRSPALAVDFLYYQVPIKELTPNPDFVPENAGQIAKMARERFTDAAMLGRHAAFTFIGLTYTAEGKTPVDLGWISQEAYDQLDETQKDSFEPRVAWSQLAYMIDPNVLAIGSPNRTYFDERREQLGEHAGFLDELASGFRQRLEEDGRSFPGLPPITYPDVDADVIAACEEAGYSQWPD